MENFCQYVVQMCIKCFVLNYFYAKMFLKNAILRSDIYVSIPLFDEIFYSLLVSGVSFGLGSKNIEKKQNIPKNVPLILKSS